MLLRPQDFVVALKRGLWPDKAWTYPQLGRVLFLSASEAHAAVRRAVSSGLLYRPAGPRPQANVTNLLEFTVHGLRYAFVAERTGLTRGHPTASAAPILDKWFGAPGPTPPVWPHPSGPAWGEGLSPLYRRAVDAALADDRLYSALALVDALRIGGARERAIAQDALQQLLAGGEPP
ncbi:MAG: hypothetical protein HY905_22670 [Deltaproteobacteria bacterium]|nr:hypothetical protein [Deltaproteobacteria bacterium]